MSGLELRDDPEYQSKEERNATICTCTTDQTCEFCEKGRESFYALVRGVRGDLECANGVLWATRHISEIKAQLKKATDERDDFVRANTELGLQLQLSAGVIADLKKVLANNKEAFRYTREYVGEKTLPAIKGWSWFDAVTEIDSALASLDTPEGSV